MVQPWQKDPLEIEKAKNATSGSESGGEPGSTANCSSGKTQFTDEEAEKVLSFFKEAGMTIELGATCSVKGQIAQLLNGCRGLLMHVERDVLA